MQFPYLDRISYTSEKANSCNKSAATGGLDPSRFWPKGHQKAKRRVRKEKKRKAYSHPCADQLFHAKEVEKKKHEEGEKEPCKKEIKKDNVNAQTPSSIPFRKPFIPETIKKE